MINFAVQTLTLALIDRLGADVSPKAVLALTLWITGFLCLLNVAMALFFHRQRNKERLSYWLAFGFELAVFVFALLFQFDVITQQHIPFSLPPGLPVNRAEILGALSIGIGLFPAAYWHRINLKALPARIAEDGKTLKDGTTAVRIRDGGPNGWMN